jgi:hypothetical protein
MNSVPGGRGSDDGVWWMVLVLAQLSRSDDGHMSSSPLIRHGGDQDPLETREAPECQRPGNRTTHGQVIGPPAVSGQANAATRGEGRFQGIDATAR